MGKKKIANLPRMFGNKNSISLILLLFKGTATLFQLLRNISFTFPEDYRVRLLLPEVQTRVLSFQQSCGALQQPVFEGQQSPKPLLSMVMCQNQKYLLMRLAGEPKKYLWKSWDQISWALCLGQKRSCLTRYEM